MIVCEAYFMAARRPVKGIDLRGSTFTSNQAFYLRGNKESLEST
jgi:hypothetical protein